MVKVVMENIRLQEESWGIQKTESLFRAKNERNYIYWMLLQL